MASDTKYTWIEMGPDEVFEAGKHYYSRFYSPCDMGALAEDPDVWNGGSLVGQRVRARPSRHLPYYKRADEHQPPTKDTNPKDAIGVQKVPISPIPPRVLLEVGNALLEGAAKYGPFNWRDAGVRATIYYDATFRHLAQWYEGENIDADSGLHHVTKAIASLVVLRDAIMCGKMVDDRPRAPTKMSMAEFNEQTAALRRRYNPKGE